MTLTQSRVTVSTGGVVVNSEGMVLLVNQHGKAWTLPKGHVEPNEEPLQTAMREIREESGIRNLEFKETLGVYSRYKMNPTGGDDTSEWKVIVVFLFKTQNLALQPQDGHDPQARWVKPDEVESLLTNSKDKAFYRSIRPRL